MTHGPVMLDLAGPCLLPEERELLRHPAAGGVILFSRNFESPEQLRALTAEIHALREPALLIAADQEGGRVQRFREGFTRLPPAAWFGRCYDGNRRSALSRAEDAGWLMAAELRAAGVDFSFAPVLDLGNGISQVIGDRAFHARPAAVAELAAAWMRGMHDAGMAAVGKHFPGHGNVAEDSHTDLPQDLRLPADIMMDDLLPFQRLIDKGIEAIMPAHVIYPRAAPEPAGFSRFWLQEILRGTLGFQGMIFSDDLSMNAAGAAGGYAERARAALAAGCDMVLVCNDRDGAETVLDALRGHADPTAHMRMIRMHGRGHPDAARLQLLPRWKRAMAGIAAYDRNATPDLPL